MEKVAHFISLKTPGKDRVENEVQSSKLKAQSLLPKLLLPAILLLAAFLRLYKISDYMTFLGDEGRDVLVVRGILHGDFTLLGPRSSAADFYYGPIYYYFITPFLWFFNYDPVGPAVFIALLGITTVFLVYFVGKRLFNETAGLLAAALFAVSPLVIAYSRSSWNPNPLPFVSLLTIFSLYNGLKNNSWKYFLLVGILMGVALQLQYITLFLAAIVVTSVLIGTQYIERKFNILLLLKRYGTIFGGFLIGFSLFLAFELKHGFPNTRTILTYIFTDKLENGIDPNIAPTDQIFNVFLKLFGRLPLRFPSNDQLDSFAPTHIFLWQLGVIVLAVVSLYFLFRAKNKLAVLFLALWFFLGWLLFGFYKKEIYDYYMGFMFPLPFLLIGNALSGMFDSKRFATGAKIVSLAVFSFLFVFNIQANPFRYAPNRQKDQVKQIAEFVLDKTDNKPYNFALITEGNSDHAYRYYFETNNHPPVTIENPQIDPERKSVTDQLLIICEDPTCQPLGNSLWEVAGFGQAEIDGEWNVSVVKVFRLKHFESNE